MGQFAIVQTIILAIVWLPLPPRYLHYTYISFGGRMVIKWGLKPLPITYYGRRISTKDGIKQPPKSG